jgi:hypothetical protein
MNSEATEQVIEVIQESKPKKKQQPRCTLCSA